MEFSRKVHNVENGDELPRSMTHELYVQDNTLSGWKPIHRKGEHVIALSTLTPVRECTDSEYSDQPNSSFFRSVMNMIGTLIGLGQLSNPYGAEKGGWVSLFVLAGLGVICCYTAYLIGKCLEKNPDMRSYIDIGQKAFGTKGKRIVTAFIYTGILMGLVSYTISLHDNLNMAFAGIPINVPHVQKARFLTAIAILVILPTLWLRKLSSIAFLSTGNIIVTMLVFITLASAAISGVIQANHSIPVLNLSKIPEVSGLYVISYSSHVIFPNIYKAMKDPSRYTKVILVSFTAVICLYTSLAFLGAKMFGPSIESQITLSMPRELIATKLALVATVLTPMTKYALQFAPVAAQLENNLPNHMKSRTKMIVIGSIGSILVLIILALALSVPYFPYILSLTGSLVSITVCITFPCIFYTKICFQKISKPLIFLNVILIAIGSFLSVSGTISSTKSLIKVFREHQ